MLRRGPRPPLPRSTHDMLREARIQQLLASEGVPVPAILAVCEDESVLGVPFYVMEALDGVVITDTVPDRLASPYERARTGDALVDTLVGLHAIDVSGGGLAVLGRPEGYLERQVSRFAGLWRSRSVSHDCWNAPASTPAAPPSDPSFHHRSPRTSTGAALHLRRVRGRLPDAAPGRHRLRPDRGQQGTPRPAAPWSSA